jgi:16S rRNA (uracil1498-N3)-methyltransferase
MRRAHVPVLPQQVSATVTLDARQSKHLRDVLRLIIGDEVELFDSSGNAGIGRIEAVGSHGVTVVIQRLLPPVTGGSTVIVATAIPKGERADWMVEKLSEVGVDELIPLECDRSVVVPAGTAKMDRWQRIATESAKQSRRRAVMRIGSIAKSADVDLSGSVALLLTSQDDAPSIVDQLLNRSLVGSVLLLIGPEGGWSDRELVDFQSRGASPARLTNTILRTETAAVVAGAIACSILGRNIT